MFWYLAYTASHSFIHKENLHWFNNRVPLLLSIDTHWLHHILVEMERNKWINKKEKKAPDKVFITTKVNQEKRDKDGKQIKSRGIVWIDVSK